MHTWVLVLFFFSVKFEEEPESSLSLSPRKEFSCVERGRCSHRRHRQVVCVTQCNPSLSHTTAGNVCSKPACGSHICSFFCQKRTYLHGETVVFEPTLACHDLSMEIVQNKKHCLAHHNTNTKFLVLLLSKHTKKMGTDS